MNQEKKATPAIKWVGGKRQLLPKIIEKLPENINNFYEPFIGGGAVTIELLNLGLIKNKVTVGDYNHELCNLYNVIINQPKELKKDLAKFESKHSKEFYMDVREWDRKPSYHKKSPLSKATRFIYLNKAGFNGLYRVNSKEQNNVPWGQRDKVVLDSNDNINTLSKKLKNIKIIHNSFEITVNTAKKGDFIYFDPPYVPLSKSSNFVGYTKVGFEMEMQFKLKELLDELTQKGVNWMQSNSSAPEICELYKDYSLNFVDASRSINCKGDGRGKIKEVIITNY
jgi:DNA adenine methylase